MSAHDVIRLAAGVVPVAARLRGRVNIELVPFGSVPASSGRRYLVVVPGHAVDARTVPGSLAPALGASVGRMTGPGDNGEDFSGGMRRRRVSRAEPEPAPS
jgi:hypothetical protein